VPGAAVDCTFRPLLDAQPLRAAEIALSIMIQVLYNEISEFYSEFSMRYPPCASRASG